MSKNGENNSRKNLKNNSIQNFNIYSHNRNKSSYLLTDTPSTLISAQPNSINSNKNSKNKVQIKNSINNNYSTSNQIQLSTGKNELSSVQININSDLAQIHFTGTNSNIQAQHYLQQKGHMVRFYSLSTTANPNNLMLYKLKDYFVLDAHTDLPATDSSDKQVLMYRNFLTDIYNTLIMPCNISNYKTVFGSNVTAYEVENITDSKIIISTVSGTALNANTPYLLKGSSYNTSPYALGLQTINYDGSKDPVTTFSAGSIHGVYATRALPTENAYFMYEDEFLPYNPEYYDNKSMAISPYKWYVETHSTSSAKAIVIDEQDATNIHTPGPKKQETGVYDLNGRLVGTSTKKPLQKGIYVVNGQKTVIQ